jgi:hypothetical protein
MVAAFIFFDVNSSGLCLSLSLLHSPPHRSHSTQQEVVMEEEVAML